MQSALSPLLTAPTTVGLAVGAAGAVALLLLVRRRRLGKKSTATKAKAAAGHDGNIERDGFFYKLEVKNRFENERILLEKLSTTTDSMARCVPEFCGVEEIDGKRYLKMRSLTEKFDAATMCIMDAKMGVRCFAEKELGEKKPRPDLFEKLLKLGLPALTRSVLSPAEIEAKEITKARWMTLRDATSSTKELGFRVDGVVTPDRKRKPAGDLATCRADSQVIEALRSFLPAGKNQKATAASVLARLDEIEENLRSSEIFFNSEVIGSSLFFVADAKGNTGVWMLDFGLTCPAEVPSGRLRHEVPWKVGNHEDGYLIGLANMRRLWRRMMMELE